MPSKVPCGYCDGMKDYRAKACSKCKFKASVHPRLGTAQDWRLHSTGYLYKFLDGRMQYQHRNVMENFLGRRLTTKEHVHHKNGDRADNRLENLEILTASDHAREHGTVERMTEMSKLGHLARWGAA